MCHNKSELWPLNMIFGHFKYIWLFCLLLFQNLCFWTFLAFLIIPMMTKIPGNTSWVLPLSQGLQNGIICGVTMAKSPLRNPKSSKFLVFGHYWPSWSSWRWPKILETCPKYSHGSEHSIKVSYVGLQWQNPHQDTQNPPNPQFLDILDVPDHPDDDQNSWKQFLSTPMVPRIPKMYHMWGSSGENEIVLMTPHSEALWRSVYS